MANRFRLFENNLLFATSATAILSDAEPTLPGTNLLQANRNKVWRTNIGTTTATAVFDLGAAYDVSAFALISSNLTTSGTVTIQGNTADSWASPAFSSGELSIYDGSYTGVLLWYWRTKNYRYWRMILDDPSNPNYYIEAGVAWLGTYIESPRNFVYGWNEEIIPLSRISYADDGTPYTEELESYKNIVLDVRFLSEEWTRTILMPLLKRNVVKKDMIIALFPERRADEGTAIEHSTNYYGRIMTARTIHTGYQRYEWPQILFRES